MELEHPLDGTRKTPGRHVTPGHLLKIHMMEPKRANPQVMGLKAFVAPRILLLPPTCRARWNAPAEPSSTVGRP